MTADSLGEIEGQRSVGANSGSARNLLTPRCTLLTEFCNGKAMMPLLPAIYVKCLACIKCASVPFPQVPVNYSLWKIFLAISLRMYINYNPANKVFSEVSSVNSSTFAAIENYLLTSHC